MRARARAKRSTPSVDLTIPQLTESSGPMNSDGFPPVQSWRDPRALKVLGMGTALPGPPVSTAELLERVETRFGVAVARRGTTFADKLKIATRHLCRDFAARHEGPRPGHANP